jgi:hypothetical protein
MTMRMALSGKPNPYPGKLGVVEVGAYADLLLVDGNPLEDITAIGGNPKWFDAEPREQDISPIKLIMKDGVIYKNTLLVRGPLPISSNAVCASRRTCTHPRLSSEAKAGGYCRNSAKRAPATKMKRAGPVGTGFFILATARKIPCDGFIVFPLGPLKFNPRLPVYQNFRRRADWVQILPPLPGNQKPGLVPGFFCARKWPAE